MHGLRCAERDVYCGLSSPKGWRERKMQESGAPEVTGSRALSPAVGEAARRLRVSASDLGTIVDVSPSIAAWLLGGEDCLHESTKQWELSVLFVELYRSLFSLNGGDDHLAQGWLHSPNQGLGGSRPIDLVKRGDGLIYLCGYVGARCMRT